MTENVAATLNMTKRSLWARLKHSLQRIYRRHALFCVKRGQLRPTVEARIELTFERAAEENLSDALSFRSNEIVSAFRRRLESGEIGLFAYHQAKAIAHGWMIVNRGTSPIFANRYFRLRPREALVNFCNVDEKYRGQGVYQAMLCELYRYGFANEPIDVIYIDTERANVPSMKAIEKTAHFLTYQHYLSIFSYKVELRWPWSSTYCSW